MVERRHSLSKDAVKAEALAPGSVGTEELKDECVTKEKINPKFLQTGATSVSFGFAATGIENVTATITFPTAFDAAPTMVVVTSNTPDINISVTGITASDFTVTARDSEGTDYTAALTVTIYWIAVA